MTNHSNDCERCYWRGRAESAESKVSELEAAMAMVGNAPSDRGRAESAEAEVARLTRLLEQRTAALTRTIDAKNAAEAKVTRVEALVAAAESNFDEPRIWTEELRAAIKGDQP